MVMNAGEFRIVNPAGSEGCLRLPGAGPAGGEYLIAALATTGQVTPGGVTVDYAMQGFTSAGAPARRLSAPCHRRSSRPGGSR